MCTIFFSSEGRFKKILKVAALPQFFSSHPTHKLHPRPTPPEKKSTCKECIAKENCLLNYFLPIDGQMPY